MTPVPDTGTGHPTNWARTPRGSPPQLQPTSETPQKRCTPLFGEVAKFRTVTENQEQQGRDGDEVERCLPQNT